MWFYVNGRFVEDGEAKVSATDRGFLYGDACFESMGVWDGRIIHLDEHVARLYRSARMLKIEVPVSPAELRALLLETASRNGMTAAGLGYLRPQVTRGDGPMGVRNTRRLGEPTLVILPQLAEGPAPYRAEGQVLRAVFSSYARPSSATLDPRIKTTNYLTSVLAFIEADERGADLAILRDPNGYVAEGHVMNLFCVRDGVISTPLEASALAGITRAQVLQVARGLGYTCRETNLTAYDFRCADEAFVTAAVSGLAAIGAIEGQPLPSPLPGPISAALRAAYMQHAFETGTPVPA